MVRDGKRHAGNGSSLSCQEVRGVALKELSGLCLFCSLPSTELQDKVSSEQ